MYVIFQAIFLVWKLVSHFLFGKTQFQFVKYHLFSYPEDSIKVDFARSLSSNPILQIDIFLKKGGEFEIDLDCGETG